MSKMKKTSGLAFHCHHGMLCEWVYDYGKRVRYIKEFKPPEEQELRLRLFRMVPDDLIPGRDSEEWTALSKASAAYHKALAAYDKALGTYRSYDMARATLDKVLDAYPKRFDSEILALHVQLCPDCPWNGRTIFPEVEK